ncbi:hypothetical protein BIW11_07165, partial [Tropilaelaps mercedesae]
EPRQVPVPLHDFTRVRGVYVNGKPVVPGISQAVPLTPIKNLNSFTDPAQSKPLYGAPGIIAPVQPASPEYYDDFAVGTSFPAGSPSASPYIPTAPYPTSVYGRPPFWVRLQRWNPFSRYYRTTYTIGAPEYPSLPPYGYVVPPVMVIPAGPTSKLEPVYSPLFRTNSASSATSQSGYGMY